MQANKRRVPVSVLVPIKNEAENLSRCLGCVQWADEIFVVDSQSTDGSAEIAERHGAKVVQFHFNGTWPKKKNWALENLPFKNEWVFILDADEVLPPEAADEICERDCERGRDRRLLDQSPFLFPRSMVATFILSELEPAAFPSFVRPLREVNRGGHKERRQRSARARSSARTDRAADMSRWTITRFLRWKFSSRNIIAIRIGRRASRPMNFLGQSSGDLSHAPVERRRRLKMLSQRLPFRPLLRFLYIYIWQKGFLDGRDGYYFARLHAIYEFLSVAKTYELRQSAPN